MPLNIHWTIPAKSTGQVTILLNIPLKSEIPENHVLSLWDWQCRRLDRRRDASRPRKGTTGVSTILLGTPVNLFISPKVTGRTFFPNMSNLFAFAAAPFSADPICPQPRPDHQGNPHIRESRILSPNALTCVLSEWRRLDRRRDASRPGGAAEPNKKQHKTHNVTIRQQQTHTMNTQTRNIAYKRPMLVYNTYNRRNYIINDTSSVC